MFRMEERNQSFRAARRLAVLLSCAIPVAGLYSCGGGVDPCTVNKTSQSVAEYASDCFDATQIHIPDFDCDVGDAGITDSGILVPTTNLSGGSCDRPNVLNHECDPGSTFHVLAKNDDAFVVAHCRKRGASAHKFADIAIIQHNRNGATCFYQALPGMSGAPTELDQHVVSPERDAGTYPFMTPQEMNANEGTRCISCHDTGPLIRSPYLAQLSDPDAGNDEFHRLPGTSDLDPAWPRFATADAGAMNAPGSPYNFPGDDFQTWRAEELTIAGTSCTGCHRMGVGSVGGEYAEVATGTSREFAKIAFWPYPLYAQDSKNIFDPLHPDESPYWLHYMSPATPPQDVATSQNLADVQAFMDCAESIASNSGPTDGCEVKQYGQGNTCPLGPGE